MTSVAQKQFAENWPESWRLLAGGHGARKGRYIDPEFTRLEFERLWSKVWQCAARLDEIPQPGDFTTYDIGDQSVIVVRVDATTIKAYHNFCPHRGTALSEGGCGHFNNDTIMCPFHGWKWDLKGNNQRIVEQHEFRNGTLKNSDVPLKTVHVEVFAGFVFINFDENPQSFAEFIEPVRKIVDGLAIGDMHHYWWKLVKVPANWKVAQEAFFETFHVGTTHPQLDDPGREYIYNDIVSDAYTHTHVEYEAFPFGHGRFFSGKKPMDSKALNPTEDQLEHMIEHMEHLVHEMDAMVLQQDVDIAKTLRGKPVPEGSSYGAEFIKAIYTKAAMEKRPMPMPTPEVAGMWGGEVFIFPNLLILPNLGNAMFYRARPDGNNPDSCIFEIWSTTTYPADKPVPRAEVQYKTDVSDPDQFLLIPRQDMGNIPRIQKGLHSKGCKQVWFASHNEKMIINMHVELDRYLGAPEAP
jgi:phenylpropionate dioxygenase-like ring-hydroxylating dioxygenase large terminal subunit